MQGARQAVNLVNGMIVDGLGHVSLDSGAPGSALANNTLSQANIHQGSIPATGRIKASPSQPSVPLSAANSLQFNQLIGGGISPSVISSHQNGASSNAGSRTSTVFTSAGPASGLPPAAAASASNSHNQHSPAHNLMIGDYVQGNMGNVLGNSFNRHQ